jgi:hypothetical protein
VRLLCFRPERRYLCDPELGSSAFPVVLVQIPMFNEHRFHLSRHLLLARARGAVQGGSGGNMELRRWWSLGVHQVFDKLLQRW